MIKDGKDFLDNPPSRTQVCIVGTGQAGITLAWYLLQQGIDVTLLEGSRVFNPGGPNASVRNAYLYNENELLYNGQSLGLFATTEPEFLIRPTPQTDQNTRERERIYGGTSTHWGGQSRPLDAITFEKRPGFPGWPITRKDLDPFYAEACRFLELYGDYYGPKGTAGYNFTGEFWARELGLEVADLQGFDVDMYQFVPGDNLQFQARRIKGQTIGESDARVILNASLLNIVQEGDKITALTVGVMDDNRYSPKRIGEFNISADVYVLACGAVANARQLLLSGLGNKDLVGRYLMAHPIAGGADAVSVNPNYLTSKQQRLLSYQNPGSKYYPVTYLAGLLSPNEDTLRDNQVGSCWFGPGGTDNFYHELIPEYESRITLSDTTTDLFDQKETKAVWVLNGKEEENFKKLADLFKQAVQLKKPDYRVYIGDWADIENRMVFNGHHIGTTRMSATAEDGVVDRDLRLHTADNLYVAGSSVWASAGISNPTFSIVAFSIRLADHLTGRLKGAAPVRG